VGDLSGGSPAQALVAEPDQKKAVQVQLLLGVFRERSTLSTQDTHWGMYPAPDNSFECCLTLLAKY
jgi:hypothetical protein